MVTLPGCKLSEGKKGVSVEMYLFPLFYKYYIHCRKFRRKQRSKKMKTRNASVWDIFFSIFSMRIIRISFSLKK